MCAQAKLLKLPEHEVKLTVDPAAVKFSTTHGGQVLLVEQPLGARAGCSHSSNKGAFSSKPP